MSNCVAHFHGNQVRFFIISNIILLASIEVWGTPRLCAEWEPCIGSLIRWPLGIPSTLVVELAEEDSLFVLVETAGQESSARSSFSSWGVDLNQVRFIYADTYSHWTRDWGPHFLFDSNRDPRVADPIFEGYPWVPGCNPVAGLAASSTEPERPYSEDDAVNAVFALEVGCSLLPFPAYLTGGNIMTDGAGTAFSTAQMLAENSGLWSETEFRDLAHDQLGIEDYQILANPEMHGIQHIDCYAKLLSPAKVLIKEVPAWHPEYACVEALVTHFAALESSWGRPWEIVRVFCDSYSGDDVGAYTNSLILNRKVLVPLFNISSDQDALDVYAEAMPGYEVIGFPWGSWYYYDALHCRTHEVVDIGMLHIRHQPLWGNAPAGVEYEVIAELIPYSDTGLIPDSLRLYYRVDGGDVNNRSLMPTGGDLYAATIPVQPEGSEIRYWLQTSDSSGRSAHHPLTGAADPHLFYAGEPLPPQLTLQPVSLSETLSSGASTQVPLFISNSGGGALPWQIQIVPTSGAVVGTGSRDLTGSYLEGADTSFVPGTTLDWTFWVYNNSPDEEYLIDIYLHFPAGVTVNSSGPFVGGSGGDMTSNGNTGEAITLHWHGETTNGWGVIQDGESAGAQVNVSIAAEVMDDLLFSYRLEGDIWGGTPHFVEGDFTLANLGLPVSWLNLEPTAGVVYGGQTDTVQVTFDAVDLLPGIYNCELIVNAVQTVPVTLEVATPAPAELSIQRLGDTILLTWVALPDAIGYQVYAADEPYGPFVPADGGTYDGTTWTAPLAGQQQFYRVTALLP